MDTLGATEPRFDTYLDALAQVDRRRILVSLLAADSGAESRIELDGGDAFSPRGDEIGLHHVHLPKLEDAGFVRWDRSVGHVRPGPAFEEIRPMLELFADNPEKLPDGWL